MTWQPLSEATPAKGQAVIYRLRPNGVQVPAAFDPKHPAWVMDGGHLQTARGHHQWRPAPAPPKKRPVRRCTLPDCDRKHFAKGLCQRHYYQERYRAKKAAGPSRRRPAAAAPEPGPKPKRIPQPPVRPWSEASNRARTRGEFDPDSRPASAPGPDPRANRHETTRVQTLGEPCPTHPTERINAFGKCPACVTGSQWAERERMVTTRPHPEGGR